MDKVAHNGPMVENTKDNMLMTKNMELAHFSGQMVENIMEVGKMANNTAVDSIISVQVKKRSENGYRESV